MIDKGKCQLDLIPIHISDSPSREEGENSKNQGEISNSSPISMDSETNVQIPFYPIQIPTKANLYTYSRRGKRKDPIHISLNVDECKDHEVNME